MKLELKDAIRLVTGRGMWHTDSCGGKLPSLHLSDGPHGLRKQELLKTFDDTLIQIYLHPLGKIMVKNDELTGALYVQSDIDLERFDALL